jgi:PEGA domain
LLVPANIFPRSRRVKLSTRSSRITVAVLCAVAVASGPAVAAGEGFVTASARIQVKPRNAEVYVDGYPAGVVDEFDGFFQRLEVPAGEHELTLYLDGYRTVRQKVLFTPGAALDIRYELQPLASGEPPEPRPKPLPGAQHPGIGPPPPPAIFEEQTSSDFGTLAVRVQPSNATVVVDGHEWKASDGDGAVVIELGEGTHEVEIRSEGLSTFRKSVRVRAGETVSLNVSLTR